MRLPIALLCISFLSFACGDDDGGGASETTDTSGPSSTEESSSSVSVGESESSSSSVGEDSSSGVESGTSSGSGSGSESGSESGSSGDSSGTDTGGSTFACGDMLDCDLATEYCERQVSDVGGMPDTYNCVPLPKPCVGVSECECLADEFCGEFCEEAPGGGATLSCPGG
jgi:hypothetical protein